MKQRSFTSRDFLALLAVLLVGLALVVGLVLLNGWLAGRYGAGADFLPAWNGTRAFLFESSDPYSRTVAEQTRQAAYGRAARAGEYPYLLDIPFPLLIVYVLPLFVYKLIGGLVSFLPFPISLPAPDAAWTLWARAAWMTLSEFGLGLLAFLSLRLADWEPKRGFRILLVAFALTWFYSAAALLDGSFSILLALALVGALAAMREDNDELAGFLLAVSALKWEISLLPWVFLVLAAWTTRRWRVFIGMAMTWLVLGMTAFLLYPDWFWPYARAVAANWRADGLLTLARFLSEWFPRAGAGLPLLIGSALLLLLVIEWFAALRGKNFRRVAWVFALAVAAAPLLGFSATFASLAPLVFSFPFILPFVWERWTKRPYLLLTLLTLWFYVIPFLLRWPAIAARLPADGLTFLLPPALTILGLYWVRWYVVRPPRTWLDGVKRELQH